MSRLYKGDLKSIIIEWRKATENSDDSELVQTLLIGDEPTFSHYFQEKDKSYPTKETHPLLLTDTEKNNFFSEVLNALEAAVPKDIEIEDLDCYRDYTIILENTDNEAFIFPIADGVSFDIDLDNNIESKIKKEAGEIPLYVLDIDMVDLGKNLDFYLE